MNGSMSDDINIKETLRNMVEGITNMKNFTV